MQTSYLNVQRGTVGPTSFSSFVDGDEWTASEFDNDSGIQRCALFCSGQFVHNLGLTTKWESKDQVRVHYILDIVTRTFDFAAKMTAKGVLKPLASISFDFFKMARINLGLGEDKGNPNLIKDCWCQDEQISIHRVLNSVELQGNRREAFAVAQEIYSKFQWNDPPIDKLRQDQAERSGPASP